MIEFRNGGSLEIVANDAELGARPKRNCGIGHRRRLTGKPTTNSLSSDEEVVTAALPSMAMCPDVPGGLLIMGSSVYRRKRLHVSQVSGSFMATATPTKSVGLRRRR